MLIDTHCHLDWESYQEDFDAVMQRNREAGIEKIITIGVDEESNEKTRSIVAKNEGVYRCVGYHPELVTRDGFNQEEINRLMKKLDDELIIKKTVGVGECGLDYYCFIRPENEIKRTEPEIVALKELQHDLFERQILFALKHGLPLSLHVRDESGDEAYRDVLQILGEYFGEGRDYSEQEFAFSIATLEKNYFQGEQVTVDALPTKTEKSKAVGVLHCVSGPIEYVQACIDMGFMVSFAGNITYKNATHIQDLARDTPLDQIVLETDGPFLAPLPYRGKRNESSYIVETAKKIAEIKNIPLDEVVRITTENSQRLFSL
ncbi:MAG: TatD family hydrolase [bacterium]|nr:TatD family hydrolase [bacterium]